MLLAMSLAMSLAMLLTILLVMLLAMLLTMLLVMLLAMLLTLGVRGGECPVIPLVHWKGVALPRQRSSRTMKTLYDCNSLNCLFSAVERSPYLRDILNYFGFIDIFNIERFPKLSFQRFLK